jgi:hypothetical protein
MDVVRDLVNKAGGRVGIATKPGEYTRFRITLPHEKSVTAPRSPDQPSSSFLPPESCGTPAAKVMDNAVLPSARCCAPTRADLTAQ